MDRTYRVEKNNNFVMLDKKFVKNKNLSLKAKGLLALMLSYPTDGWKFREIEILKHSTDGKASFKSGIKELEEHGYIKKTSLRNDKGQFIGVEWIVLESPELLQDSIKSDVI